MKRPKVLLISPNLRPFEFTFEMFVIHSGYFPMGLAYLASFVGKHGYEVKILDALADNCSQEEIHAAIKEFAPDVVGVTSPLNHEFGISIFKACKGINPKIVTVLGGLTPTFMPLEIMEHVPELDCIICGEGEIPFLYLLRALEGEMSMGDIKGLVYRKDRGTIVANDGRYRVEELDSLPFPSKDRFLTKKGVSHFRHKRALIAASRGCHYGCKFCVVNKHFGKGMRFRSPQSVVAELREGVEKYQIHTFGFGDSTFTADPQYTHRLLDEIINSDIHMKFRFRCMTRLDRVDMDLLKKLKAANCCSVGYGVESCSQKVLDSYNKNLNVKKTIDIFNKTKKVGISARALFVFNQYDVSGEAEMKRREKDLIAFLKKLKPSELVISPLVINPNSPMYEDILKEGGIDAEGYKELFKGRLIPSRRMPSDKWGRSVLKISLKNRINFAKYALSKVLR